MGRIQGGLTALIVILLAFLVFVYSLGERFNIFNSKLRQLLRLRTIGEFFVDFELTREAQLPMSIAECDWQGNFTNRQFYSDYIGGFFPCIFRSYISELIATLPESTQSQIRSTDYNRLDLEKVREQLIEQKPMIMEKNLRYEHAFLRSYKSGVRTETVYEGSEQLMCCVGPELDMRLLTAFQQSLIRPKNEDDSLSPNRTPADLFNLDLEEFRDAHFALVYPLQLSQGDCIYIPAYWWHQIETPANKPTIALSYWYEVSSEWLKIVFQGLENNQI